MTTLRWLYCYSCLFDRLLVEMKYAFILDVAYCLVCSEELPAEYLYTLMMKASNQ